MAPIMMCLGPNFRSGPISYSMATVMCINRVMMHPQRYLTEISYLHLKYRLDMFDSHLV